MLYVFYYRVYDLWYDKILLKDLKYMNIKKIMRIHLSLAIEDKNVSIFTLFWGRKFVYNARKGIGRALSPLI